MASGGERPWERARVSVFVCEGSPVGCTEPSQSWAQTDVETVHRQRLRFAAFLPNSAENVWVSFQQLRDEVCCLSRDLLGLSTTNQRLLTGEASGRRFLRENAAGLNLPERIVALITRFSRVPLLPLGLGQVSASGVAELARVLLLGRVACGENLWPTATVAFRFASLSGRGCCEAQRCVCCPRPLGGAQGGMCRVAKKP